MVCRTWSMKALFPFLVVLQYTDMFVIRLVQETVAHGLPCPASLVTSGTFTETQMSKTQK